MYMVSYNDNWSVNKWCSSIQPIPDIQTNPEIRRNMIISVLFLVGICIIGILAYLGMKGTGAL
jgi:hypothetical protein